MSETYYSCTLTTENAFIQATGLANSNANLYLQLSWTIFIIVIVWYLQKTGADIKTIAQKKELDAIKKNFDDRRKALLTDLSVAFFSDLSESR